MFLSSLVFLIGLVVLLYGADMMVKGASRLALSLGMSSLIVGLTVVSFGTSAPELAISVTSALKGNADLAVGNVIGSNIANVLLILGVAAALATIVVKRQLIRFDVPVMIGCGLLMWAFGLDRSYQRWEGFVLFGGSIFYTLTLIKFSRDNPPLQERADVDPGQSGVKTLAQIVGGIILLVVGSQWLVKGATDVAASLGVSSLIIGLTVVAIGTSAPELATTIVAIMRGERDLAVGNVVGSCIFNVLVVLGLTAAISPLAVPIAPPALAFDLPFMAVVLFACFPILFVGYRIFRWEGVMFLLIYGIYTTYLALNAQEHSVLAQFNSTVIWIVLPLIVGTAAALTLNKVIVERKEKLNGSGE